MERYNRFLRNSGSEPEAGVYTSGSPIRNLNDRPIVRPSSGLTITVEPKPEGEFTMRGEKTTLAGTFELPTIKPPACLQLPRNLAHAVCNLPRRVPPPGPYSPLSGGGGVGGEAQMQVLLPSATARLRATVMPRSLKDERGVSPSPRPEMARFGASATGRVSLYNSPYGRSGW